MNQYYKESTKASIYKKVINQVFNTDIGAKGRKRNLVNARMIFTQLMRNDGVTYQAIAFHLNLESHATIMHYLKQIKFLLTYDRDLIAKYEMCVRMYKITDPSIDILRRDELKNRVLCLEDRNKLLSLEIEGLKRQLQENNNQDKRFKTIFDMIRNRTRPDTETVIEKKLNTIFNGIYD
jgi:hypothetical protein